MKHFMPFSVVILAVALLASGCKKSAPTEGINEIEQPASASDKSASTDREPIANTSPEGSSMDTTSNAYIVFDGSGSMAGEPIEQAKRAVTTFIAAAPADLNIGLYVFDKDDSTGREVVPLGRGEARRGELARALRRVEAGGGTPLGEAIKVGIAALIKQFQKQLRYGDIRLIVVTDGAASDEQAFEQSIEFAQKYQVPIYTVGFRIGNSHALRQFSESYFTANDEKQLLGAMRETLAELDDSTSLDF